MINNTEKLDIKWMENAACKDMGSELFMSENKQDKKMAIAVCSGCLVIKECLDYAFVNHERGIWGGTTDLQRVKIKRFENRRLKLTQGLMLNSEKSRNVEI